MSKNLQKRIVLYVVIAAVIGAGVYVYFSQNAEDNGLVSCPADTKLCPDGTTVGRTGPNCEFAECSTVVEDDSTDERLERMLSQFDFGNFVQGSVFVSFSEGTSERQASAVLMKHGLEFSDGWDSGLIGGFVVVPSGKEKESARALFFEPSVLWVEPNRITETSSQEENWVLYTNDEWKYSFEYPGNFTLSEEANGYKVVVTPPEGFSGPAEWFSVVVIQHPEVVEEEIPETLFHLANYPDGSVAWLKDWKFYEYENYHIETTKISFGKSTERAAFRVRERSINKDLGEYRSIVYVLRDPAVYRITHDLFSEQVYGDILARMEDSFEVLE